MIGAHVPVGQGQTAHAARRWGKVRLTGQVEEGFPEVGPSVGSEEVAEGHVLLECREVHLGRRVEPVPSLLLLLLVLMRCAAQQHLVPPHAAVVIIVIGAASSTILGTAQTASKLVL